ncbi:MAG: hypothetical protein Q9227_002843 [Pyrenula ochraceoflavens]
MAQDRTPEHDCRFVPIIIRTEHSTDDFGIEYWPYSAPRLEHGTDYVKHDSLERPWLPDTVDSSTLLPGHQFFHKNFVDTLGTAVRCEIYVNGSSKLKDFLRNELDQADSVADLVVVSGPSAAPWASSCGEYVDRVWPQSSQVIRALFSHLQRMAWEPQKLPKCVITGNKNPPWFGDELSVFPLPHEKSCFTMQGLEFRMIAKPHQLAGCIEALAWLMGGLQTNENAEPEFSAVLLRTNSMTNRRICELDDSARLESKESRPDSCWTALTPGTVSAAAFPVPTRHEAMKGLEMSFELMCFLCGLEYETIEEGGVILYGQRSLVYPVRQIADSVQWHFEPRELKGGIGIARDLPAARWLIDDLEILREAKRHFLGLWDDPRITLGTNALDPCSITWSRAKEVTEERQRDNVTVGATICLPKVLNFQMNTSYKVARSRKNVYSVGFEAKMLSLTSTPVLLYSPSEQRAWIVAYTSLILHLARARADHQRALGISIPPCALTADGGKAAFDVIQRFCKNPFRSGQRLSDLEELQRAAVEDYFNDIWAVLDCATRESYKSRRLFRTSIVGYEMADIAKVKTKLRMKQHTLEAFTKGWTPLLTEVPLALFYEGMEDPILPNVERDTFPRIKRGNEIRTPKGNDLHAHPNGAVVFRYDHNFGNINRSSTTLAPNLTRNYPPSPASSSSTTENRQSDSGYSSSDRRGTGADLRHRPPMRGSPEDDTRNLTRPSPQDSADDAESTRSTLGLDHQSLSSEVDVNRDPSPRRQITGLHNPSTRNRELTRVPRPHRQRQNEDRSRRQPTRQRQNEDRSTRQPTRQRQNEDQSRRQPTRQRQNEDRSRRQPTRQRQNKDRSTRQPTRQRQNHEYLDENMNGRSTLYCPKCAIM